MYLFLGLITGAVLVAAVGAAQLHLLRRKSTRDAYHD
jgi:uncharacterized integral membrane protein